MPSDAYALVREILKLNREKEFRQNSLIKISDNAVETIRYAITGQIPWSGNLSNGSSPIAHTFMAVPSPTTDSGLIEPRYFLLGTLTTSQRFNY